MATQSPPASQLPPDLPHLPEISTNMTNYLRQFSLWAKKGLDSKVEPTTALPANLLQSFDTAPRITPKVYKLQVNEAGVASLAPVALGNPATPTPPGTEIPIFPEAPSDGTTYGRLNTGWTAVVPLAGATMTGILTLSADPTNPLEAATKQYVDTGVAAGSAASLPLTGGTLTGPLVATDITANTFKFATLPVNAATDAAAASAGVPVGGVYRNGSILMVRVV